jgi:hypothetical protein
MAVVNNDSPQPSGIIPRMRIGFVPGGAAGNFTVTGIRDGFDRIISVLHLTLTLSEGAPNTTNAWSIADLTSEFSITASDTINNGGGTATTNDLLMVIWYDADWGEQSDPGFRS